uniref:Uncharacterized protein n=1 Tax=Triticum urartu TaxID=4572 RepID=A0A8R7PPD8_TRIUA
MGPVIVVDLEVTLIRKYICTYFIKYISLNTSLQLMTMSRGVKEVWNSHKCHTRMTKSGYEDKSSCAHDCRF